jgi:hypothetical protein
MREPMIWGGVIMRAIGMILAILLVCSTTGVGTAAAEDCTVPDTKMGRDCVANCDLAEEQCAKSCGGDRSKPRYVDCADCGRFQDACVCSCASTTRRFFDGLLFRHGK